MEVQIGLTFLHLQLNAFSLILLLKIKQSTDISQKGFLITDYTKSKINVQQQS